MEGTTDIAIGAIITGIIAVDTIIGTALGSSASVAAPDIIAIGKR